MVEDRNAAGIHTSAKTAATKAIKAAATDKSLLRAADSTSLIRHKKFSPSSRDASMVSNRTFGSKPPKTPWESLSKVPEEFRDYVIDAPVWTDVKKDDMVRHSHDDQLDPFQRTLLCMKGDVHQKMFGAREVTNLAKLDARRTFIEILPILEAEAKKSRDANFHAEIAASTTVLFRISLDGKRKDHISYLILMAKFFVNLPERGLAVLWLRVLEAIMDLLSPADALKQMLPFVLEKSQDGQNPLSKNIACILLRKLSKLTRNAADLKNPGIDIKQTWIKLLGIVEKLAREESNMVRTALTLSLPDLLFPNPKHPANDKILKILLLLGEGRLEPDVVTALVIAHARALIILRGEMEFMREFLRRLMQFVRKGTYEKPWNLPMLIHFAKWLVPVANAIKDKLSPEDRAWFMDAYFFLSQVDEDLVASIPAALAEFFKKFSPNTWVRLKQTLLSTPPHTSEVKKRIHHANEQGEKKVTLSWHPASSLWSIDEPLELSPWMIRVECAIHVLGMHQFVKGVLDFKAGIHAAVVNFTHDPHPQVRRTMARRLVNFFDAESSTEATMLLKDDLITMLSDDSVDIVEAVAPSISKILKQLANRKIISPNSESEIAADILSALLFCEERLSQTFDWRVHSTFLVQLTAMPQCMHSEAIFRSLIPVLINRVKYMPQLPTRLAATQALVACLRYCQREDQRESIRSEIRSLATSKHAQDRMVYLYISNVIMERFSRKYFKQHFFETTLDLAGDEIPNVRTKAVKLIPRIQSTIAVGDDPLIKSLEKVLEHLQTSESDKDAFEAVQIAVQAMAKIGINAGTVGLPSSVSQDDDKRKEQEEIFIMTLDKNPLKNGLPAPKVAEARKVSEDRAITEKRDKILSMTDTDSQAEATLVYPSRRASLLVNERQHSRKGSNKRSAGLPTYLAKGTVRPHPRGSIGSSNTAYSAKGPLGMKPVNN